MDETKYTTSHVYSSSDRLGSGATGEVFKGINKKTGDVVALKILEQKKYVSQQIEREIHALTKLKHPNIIRFLQCEQDYETKKLVLVMELCERGSVYDFLREPENAFGLSEGEFLRFTKHVVAGTKHLRDNGYSHRDIKPGNILIFSAEDGSNIYKLSDFGTAKPLQNTDMFSSVVGTEEYLHPDIYNVAFINTRSPQMFSINADLWSVAVTLYHCASGCVPFQAYRGRQDRITMYNILSNRKMGYISGRQIKDGGDVIWQKVLPLTCRLSSPLRSNVTKIISKMFDSSKEELLYNFDLFFCDIENIVSSHKTHLHLFHAATATSHRLFLNSDSNYDDLTVYIQTLTNNPKADQSLLFQNTSLCDLVTPDTHVALYPHTSAQDPLVLVSKETEESDVTLRKWHKILPPSKHFEKERDIFADYPVARSIIHKIHYQRASVRDLVRAQTLYSSLIFTYGKKFQEKITLFEKLFSLVKDRSRDLLFFSSSEFKLDQPSFVRLDTNGDVIEDSADSICRNVNDTERKFVNLRDRYTAAKESWEIQDCTLVKNKKWEGTMDRLTELADQRMIKFNDYKAKRILTHHEKLLMEFDKTAMQHLMDQSDKLFGECVDSLVDTHNKYVVWQSHYSRFAKDIENLESMKNEILESINGIFSTIKEVPDLSPCPSFSNASSSVQETMERAKQFQKELEGMGSEAQESRNLITAYSELIADLPEIDKPYPT